MVSWWLILIAIILSFLVLGLVFYLVFLYSSEEDRNQAWLPKGIVILGLSLACFNVLLLPYDVANRMNPAVADSTGGGINTVLLWQIIMYAIAVMTFLIVPFCMIYYESMDPDQPNVWSQIKPAICGTLITVTIFVILLVVLWLVLGKAEIPYVNYTSGAQNCTADAIVSWGSASSDATLEVRVSIFVYLVGLMSAIGWLLFFIFGGIGLAALPMDLIKDFRDRPRPMTVHEYAARKEAIGAETVKLIEDGKNLEKSTSIGRKKRQKTMLFRRKVAALEDAYEKLTISYEQGGGSILSQFVGLVVGILGVLLSICWVLHIILYNMTNVWPFLNIFFISLDSAFSLLGTVAYGIFAFYLLWCVVKGCTKFGLSCLIFTVYPMKLNGTMMNAFLFNTLLILIASVSCVQFCAISFREYASNTAVDTLFTTYVARLKYISYLIIYLQYPMAGISFLSFLWLALRPKCCEPKPDSDDDE